MSRPSRAGAAWSAQDTAVLVDGIRRGTPLNELARALQRTTGALQARCQALLPPRLRPASRADAAAVLREHLAADPAFDVAAGSPSRTSRRHRQDGRRTAAMPVRLSTEQRRMIDAVRAGRDVIVDATVGSGKTTAIQALCTEVGRSRKVLYLTYSKLLKADAQRRVRHAKVQNYHGIVYPSLVEAGIRCGIGESIRRFNAAFTELSAGFPRFDLLVVDEYQDINEEYAQLLRNIKSLNPSMQTVLVGDLAQKVQSNTTLDVQRFTREITRQAELMPFTQSFRVGPELGALLSEAWNKPVVGVNRAQTIQYVSYDEALEFMAAKSPGDLLCLGRRNGQMAEALNHLERKHGDVFNKKTVYASIRDGDTSVTYNDDTAVFTTFDSSKGLERSASVVFDYDETTWDMRCRFPGVDKTVLRNVFLVAASRGKNEVVFVRSEQSHRQARSIGFIPVQRFTGLLDDALPKYEKPLLASDCFDFTYAENLQACVDLLDRQRLDDGTGEEIDIDRVDGLIDLSPVVGHYQEAVFFDRYNPAAEVLLNPKPIAKRLRALLNEDPWHNSLVLTAVDTDQMRYAEQVTRKVGDEVRDAVTRRLATQLPRDCEAQVSMTLSGLAVASSAATPITFTGVADAVHDGRVFELKFVSELDHAMFLQLALYLVMSGHRTGVLWNTRTDERWAVRVPDRERFMHAVIVCVTKQRYRTFQPATPPQHQVGRLRGISDGLLTRLRRAGRPSR
ncbi:AAA family ATPase [Lentzea sp. DG1S-22]|uniref:DEAD/DEAH box helicase family protein n=1 Tax=Lentzea sp. DG1S-22 TaxID=3108822 RepID=UPI002E78E44F|nr:AAA family ATPase [Lentzea sp. DG1S-22]WVH82879.1 AAA family ATPase [Lentzea sp. DG1S-22]